MYPLFVCEGTNVRVEVPSMPGVFKLSVDEAVKETEAALKDGVRSILLFGVPDSKDDSGSAAWAPENPVQVAIRTLKEKLPQVILASDVCLCGYTSHGHCGVIVDDEIANDVTVEQLVRIAISHAEAGADIIAPSDMMDGRVKPSAKHWTTKGTTMSRSCPIQLNTVLPFMDLFEMLLIHHRALETDERIKWILQTQRKLLKKWLSI